MADLPLVNFQKLKLNFFYYFLYLDPHKVANQVGHNLRLPIYSIDQLIIDALIENESQYAIELNNRINESFQKIASKDDLIKTENEGFAKINL